MLQRSLYFSFFLFLSTFFAPSAIAQVEFNKDSTSIKVSPITTVKKDTLSRRVEIALLEKQIDKEEKIALVLFLGSLVFLVLALTVSPIFSYLNMGISIYSGIKGSKIKTKEERKEYLVGLERDPNFKVLEYYGKQAFLMGLFSLFFLIVSILFYKNVPSELSRFIATLFTSALSFSMMLSTIFNAAISARKLHKYPERYDQKKGRLKIKVGLAAALVTALAITFILWKYGATLFM
jgi:hypothetical protein